ncbi:MAG: AI-2E family transporter [Methyloligellaceae bacterium]
MSETLEQKSSNNIALGIMAAGVVMIGLIWGSSFLLPLAIAILLWNLLEAVIARLTGSLYIPRIFAMIIAIGLVAFGFFLISRILMSQGDAVVAAAPKYTERLKEIIGHIGNWLGPEMTERIKNGVAGLQYSNSISGFLGGAQATLTNAVLVVLYVGFLLAEGRNVSKKIVRLFPEEERSSRVRAILKSLSENVRKYIWIKTIMSIITGTSSYIILKYLNVDFAETWALVIFLLNYIPTIGSILGVIFPAVIALIQFDTYTPFLIIALGLTAIQFTIGNVIEPMFMGNSLNLSAFVIILSLTFWGTIWGAAGMVLSIPITVMMMIVAAHVPSWQWVAIMLSRDGNIETR